MIWRKILPARFVLCIIVHRLSTESTVIIYHKLGGSFMACYMACHLNVNDNDMRALCTSMQDPDQFKPADFVWAYGAESPPSPVSRV